MTGTWDERLTAARATAASQHGRHVPTGLRDQLDAAAAEAAGVQHRLLAVANALEPGRGWGRGQADETAGSERTAHAIAALTGCRMCHHLRQTGPQPAVARLALRRVDCRRCLATVRRPPPDEDDRCDWCGQHGVETFTPVSIQLGAALVLGDACPTCASRMGAP